MPLGVVTADAWVQAAAVVVVALVGAALAGMRRWANRVEKSVDLANSDAKQQQQLLQLGLGAVETSLQNVRERLVAVETAQRLTAGVVLTTGPPPHRHAQTDVQPPETGD